VDHRRVQREDALDALAVRNLAHREILVEALAGAADAHALIGLHAGALALDHLDVDDHGVARGELGNVLAGGKLRHLLFFELLDHVHGIFLRRLHPVRGVPPRVRGCFYAKVLPLSRTRNLPEPVILRAFAPGGRPTDPAGARPSTAPPRPVA